MAIDRSRFIAKFSEEAKDHIDALNEGLLKIEKGEKDEEILNDIFRAAHSIKGTSRMLKLNEITELSHKLEDILDAIRKGSLGLTRDLSNLLFKSIDKISEMIDTVVDGKEPGPEYLDICEELISAANIDASTEQSEPESEKEVLEELSRQDEPEESKKETPPEKQADKIIEKTYQVHQENPQEQSPASTETKKGNPPQDKPSPVKSEMIRVSASKLDELINLAGEMTSAHTSMKETLTTLKETTHSANRLLETFRNSRYDLDLPEQTSNHLMSLASTLNRQLHNTLTSFKGDVSFNELFTGDLQERALKMRMLPLSTVFDTFRRSVRDMSRSLGKEVELLIEGEETELDKKIIEQLGDPLMHMIRNAIDHGIETGEERIKKGKPSEGTIKLIAMYEGGNVIIIINDDGNGIPIERLEAKVLEKKWFTESELEKMTRQEKLSLIFRPGFSTSQLITDFSGRGVGMDVVRENIVENLKGSIDIDTREGEGTTFTLRLPSTLAIMRLLLFEISNITFSIPSDSVTEVQSVVEDEIIDVVDRKALRLREQIIPVAYLDTLLGLPESKESDKKDKTIIILNTGIEKLGIIIDKLLEEQDMVIKSLPAHMHGENWVSGVSISGKGDVINVLNIAMLVKAAKELNWAKPRASKAKSGVESKKILVVDDSINTREIEKEILESYGYLVDLAKDGMEALEKAKNKVYDLVVTDVEMPRMDGFTLTETLRKEKEYASKPIIIVTSRDKLEDKRRGVQVGASAYILKGSFDQSNLLDTVESLIGSSN